jgi:hypothetical protein
MELISNLKKSISFKMFRYVLTLPSLISYKCCLLRYAYFQTGKDGGVYVKLVKGIKRMNIWV